MTEEIYSMDSTDSVGTLFKQIHDITEKNINNMLRPEEMTMAQLHLLFALMGKEECICSLKELEKHLCVAQSTTVVTVKRLEQKGFVESFTDPEDKRIKKIRITPSGLEVCRKAQMGLELHTRRLFDGFTPEEEALFLQLLQRVRDNLG